MCVIKSIREVLEENFNDVSVTIYSAMDIVFEIYEKKLPITVDALNEDVYVDLEHYSDRLYEAEIGEIHKILKILKEHIEEIKGWVL